MARHGEGRHDTTAVISLTPESEATLTTYVQSIEAQPTWHAQLEARLRNLESRRWTGFWGGLNVEPSTYS